MLIATTNLNRGDEVRLCGIDSSSTCTSISLFENGEYKSYKIAEVSKKYYPTQWDRVDQMIILICKILDQFQPDIVYQEDSWKGQNIDTLKCLTTIMGAVRHWALDHGCEYYKILPSSWRGQLGLNEYMKKRPDLKDKTIEFVKERYGINPETDDVSDSICIGLAGLKLIGEK